MAVGVKLLGCKTDQSYPPSAKVKKGVQLYLIFTHMPSMHAQEQLHLHLLLLQLTTALRPFTQITKNLIFFAHIPKMFLQCNLHEVNKISLTSNSPIKYMR